MGVSFLHYGPVTRTWISQVRLNRLLLNCDPPGFFQSNLQKCSVTISWIMTNAKIRLHNFRDPETAELLKLHNNLSYVLTTLWCAHTTQLSTDKGCK